MSMRSTFWVVLVSGAMTTTAWAIPLRTEDAKLTPSDGGRPQAVALHGNLIAVGVPVSGARGAVYVFENVGGIWTEQIKLVETSVFLFDNYGAAVALENDLLVVGAPFYEPTSSGAGSAFVYRNGPGGWALEQQLISSGSMLDDQFGKSVSISGDRIAVSANQENLGEGAVYVFLYDGLNWVEEARITSSDLSVGDSFGRSVSLDGGLLGVGASNDDDACPLDPACGSGSAYVFRREGINWIEEAKLTASDAAERDLFGTSISLSSGSIVVGAGGNDDAGTNSGSAYVFRRYGTKWVQEAKLVASDAESLDTFGFSVFLDGDSAISGACCKDGIASDTGSAYLYQRFGTTWFEAVILVASDPSQGAGLGNHVAIDGNTAVAAASSAVYVYSLTGVPPVIPASSSLGLLIGALLLLGFGGVMIRRRSQRRLSEHSPVQGTWDTNLLVAAAICSFSSSLLAQIPDFSVAHHPQQLLVRFKPSATVQARQDFHSKVGSQELKAYTLVPGLVLVDVQGGDLQAACGEYAGNSNVLYAEPNYGLAQAGDCDVCVATDPNCPNDPEFDKLWGLHNTGQTLYPPWPEPDDEDSGICDADIDALEAWAIWTGDSDFRIAVLDTGVDYNHPDLQPNMSATLGYDFIWDDADPSPEPEDSYHGTHVAGTIGAVGDNGAGVVGVNWDCEIVALKVLGDGNLVSAAVDALEYVVDNNIKVSNNSWGVPYFSNALLDAIYASQAIGHILVLQRRLAICRRFEQRWPAF